MMFVVRGPVEYDSPVYIERENALRTVSRWLEEARCVGVILGARQTGKTTLCHSLRARLGDQYAFSYIDFQGFDGETWNECVGYIADKLAELCPMSDIPERPKKGAELSRFLRELAPRVPTKRIVIIFEELGGLPVGCRERLAQSTRSLFNARLYYPALQRYVYLVVGAYEVRDLAGTKSSPLWNVAEKLYLEDFTLAEVEGLVRAALAAIGMMTEDGIRRLAEFVHQWTTGHPYWTQRLARELAIRHLASDPDFIDGEAAQAIVHRLVRIEDANLPHLFELLERERAYLEPFLESIRNGGLEFSPFDRRIATLELIGIIANRDGYCAIRNRIYEMALAQRSMPDALAPSTRVEHATVLILDMVGYSQIAKYLQYGVGVDAVALLGDSIQAQIRKGLEVCGLDEMCVHRFTGDGAILRFDEARQAHEFAVCFYAVVHARNREIPDRTLWREFRLGAATGEIVWSEGEPAGLVFTQAQRLESGGAHGHFLIDTETWNALPDELASRYESEEEILVKRFSLNARRLIVNLEN